MTLLFLSSCGDNGAGDNPVAGDAVFHLKTPSGVDFDWKAAPNALVNGASCKITLSEGSPAIGVEESSAGEYEIIIPAEAYSRARKCFVLPPAQIPSASGAADPRFFPMHARTDVSGEVYLEPLVGIVKINVKGAGRLMSAYLSAPSLSGTFGFDGKAFLLTLHILSAHSLWSMRLGTVQDWKHPDSMPLFLRETTLTESP